MHAGDGGKFDAVKRHDLGMCADSTHNIERLYPAESVGLRGTRCGDDAGVESIDVDGQKDFFATNPTDEFG